MRVKVRLSELLERGVEGSVVEVAAEEERAARRRRSDSGRISSVYRILEAHQQRLKKEKRQAPADVKMFTAVVRGSS